MELSQKYVYKIWQTSSFSKAAKELYISQPSLSATVKKLENELGFDIFDRSKSPVTVTPEGGIYIEYLEKLLESELELQHRINNLKDNTVQIFAVGGSNYLSQLLLPKLCGELHRAMPDVYIKVDMNARRDLNQKLDKNNLDCIIAYLYDDKKYTGIPIVKEAYYLALRRDTFGADALLPYAIERDRILAGNVPVRYDSPPYEITKGIRLLSNGRASSVYSHLHNYMELFDISVCRVINSRNFGFYFDMMLEGMGAVITTDIVIASKPHKSEEVLYIPINANVSSRTAHIICKKGTQHSESMKKFIEIAARVGKGREFLS